MKNVLRQLTLLRPDFSLSSRAALLLAFLLVTHVFWCSLSNPFCHTEGAHQSVSASVSIVTHAHFETDICAGLDESKNRVSAAVALFIAPMLVWVALVFLVATQLLFARSQRAQFFGRDGPICVPPLWSCLLRASLPHRAPPVFLN